MLPIRLPGFCRPPQVAQHRAADREREALRQVHWRLFTTCPSAWYPSAMNHNTPSPTIEKLVCWHGDLFFVGFPTPFSRNRTRCNSPIYPRVAYDGPNQCLECQAPVGGYHRPHCPREKCAHCSRRLNACLRRRRRGHRTGSPAHE